MKKGFLKQTSRQPNAASPGFAMAAYLESKTFSTEHASRVKTMPVFSQFKVNRSRASLSQMGRAFTVFIPS